MSKELEALQELREITKNQHWIVQRFATSHLDLIETALKEYELMKEIRITARFDLAQVNKEHKALEIIKELFKEMGLKSIFSNDNIVLIVDDSEFEHWHKCKTKEEYELLKEVLVCKQ